MRPISGFMMNISLWDIGKYILKLDLVINQYLILYLEMFYNFFELFLLIFDQLNFKVYLGSYFTYPRKVRFFCWISFLFEQTIHWPSGFFERTIENSGHLTCVDLIWKKFRIYVHAIIILLIWGEALKYDFLVENETVAELMKLKSLLLSNFYPLRGSIVQVQIGTKLYWEDVIDLLLFRIFERLIKEIEAVVERNSAWREEDWIFGCMQKLSRFLNGIRGVIGDDTVSNWSFKHRNDHYRVTSISTGFRLLWTTENVEEVEVALPRDRALFFVFVLFCHIFHFWERMSINFLGVRHFGDASL